MYFGCAWYPEQWPTARWGEDLRLMREAEMNVVRVAEFAWSRLEPRDGVFEFDWLEAAIEAAVKAGMKVVVGTPTAAPPAWLTAAHPEVLRLNPGGTHAGHGGRGQFNPASEVYLGYCRRIAEAMGKRFGKHPAVIGWQIDNEYWPFSWDEDTRRQWQGFLREEYGTLDALNSAWTTAYWSQEYSDWAQIPLSTDWQNPCLLTAFRRFFTRVYQRYQAAQMDALRPHLADDVFVTHNFHGWFEHGDPRVLCETLDFASFDPYVGTGHLRPAEMGLRLDLVRGFKRQAKGFWVMETQPGHVNWAGVNNMLDRGEMRAMAWHQVGHGAEAVLFWQWRSARGGQEQYHGAVLGQDGRPRPMYGEVQQIGREFKAAAEALADTRVQTPVALLWSFDDRWALREQKHHKDFDPAGHAEAYYAALRRAGLDVDVIAPEADLAGYAVVVAPHLHLVEPPLVERLAAFVRGGGHLVLGVRSGKKDGHNALREDGQPGAGLAELLGGRVTEYYALEGPVTVTGTLPNGSDVLGAASIFAEWLTAEAPGCEVILRYGEHSWLAGQAAALTRVVGKGRVTYVGAWLDPKAMDKLMAWATAGIEPVAAVTEGSSVEVSRRVGPRGEVIVLINHTTSERICHVRGAMHEVLTGRAVGPEVMLGPRGVMVLTNQK